jgi:hypothetical protein
MVLACHAGMVAAALCTITRAVEVRIGVIATLAAPIMHVMHYSCRVLLLLRC